VTNSPKPTVYVVDDDAAMRRSLARLLRSAGYTAVLFASAEDFLRGWDDRHPSCLVLDVRLGSMDGLQLQRELASQKICIPIVMISGHAEVPKVVQALQAGAINFLEKPYRAKEFLQSVQQGLEQDVQLQRHRTRHAELTARMQKLTPRELEVMELLVEGKSTKQVAIQLGISSKTADIHRSRVLEKTQADNVVELLHCVGLPVD